MIDHKESIRLYIEAGLYPGGFLTAVLHNDLMGAVSKADLENQKLLAEITIYVIHNVPANAWGSPKKVEEWISRRRNERTKATQDDSPTFSPYETM